MPYVASLVVALTQVTSTLRAKFQKRCWYPAVYLELGNGPGCITPMISCFNKGKFNKHWQGFATSSSCYLLQMSKNLENAQVTSYICMQYSVAWLRKNNLTWNFSIGISHYHIIHIAIILRRTHLRKLHHLLTNFLIIMIDYYHEATSQSFHSLCIWQHGGYAVGVILVK